MWPGHACQGSVFPRTCQRVCRRESTSPAPATPSPRPRLPEIPSPRSRPGTHRDRSLIHIFSLGADFSSRGDGQSDSSISGGLRGDSSMLSLCLRNGGRRRHRGSASARSPEPLAARPGPFPPAAGADQPGRCLRARPKLAALRLLRLLLSRCPAELWLPVRALGAAAAAATAAARCRGRLLCSLLPRPAPLPALPPLSARRLVSHSSRPLLPCRGRTQTAAPRPSARSRARGTRAACGPRGGCERVFTRSPARGRTQRCVRAAGAVPGLGLGLPCVCVGLRAPARGEGRRGVSPPVCPGELGTVAAGARPRTGPSRLGSCL